MKKYYRFLFIAIAMTLSGVLTSAAPAVSQTLVHFWYFNQDLPNELPLTTIDATYSITAGATRIEFQSALQGYPFTSEHADWRKASLERRNAPTSLNYRPIANAGKAYSESDMRGIQVKQPFTGSAGQNTLVFHLPSTGFRNLVFAFAAINEGGAQSLLIDYSTEATPSWITTGLASSTLALADTYSPFTVDFSQIANANNNANFKVRIRFAGNNMSAEDGGRVSFNNFSLEGAAMEGVNLPPVITNAIKLQRLIAAAAATTIDLTTVFSDPEGSNLTYSVNSNRTQFVTASVSGNTLSIQAVKTGDSQLTLSASDGTNPAVEMSFRVLVYPAAFNISQGNFVFDRWNSNEPEYSYPANMIFVQSDKSDPGLNNDLSHPYFIPHDDYHADDAATVGFPYNNISRTRISGLGADGIAFINTGRDRDLGGAIVALNTTGQSGASINFTTGTLIRNERIYSIRLQYRVGTTGGFTDIEENGQPVQYVAANDGDVMQFTNIALPAEALGQAYVQLLWRYLLHSGETGPRSMLRLDNITVNRFTNNPVVDAPDVNIYARDRRIYVNGLKNGNVIAEVYNITGQKIYSRKMNGEGVQYLDAPLTPGIYIVTLQSGAERISRKVVVQ
jgi:hypothetical protein